MGDPGMTDIDDMYNKYRDTTLMRLAVVTAATVSKADIQGRDNFLSLLVAFAEYEYARLVGDENAEVIAEVYQIINDGDGPVSKR